MFRDGDEIELGSRNERPLTRYFPELLEPLREQLPDRGVIDGEIVDRDRRRPRLRRPATAHPPGRVAGQPPGRRDPGVVRRLRPARARRRDLRDAPLRERRELLEAELGAVEPPLHLTPGHRRPRPGGRLVRALRGRRARRRDRQAARRHLSTRQAGAVQGEAPSAPPTASSPASACTRAATASARCCSGCSTTSGHLHHVGVATSFTAKRRVELVDEIAPYRDDALDDHPWRDWTTPTRTPPTRAACPAGQSRWNAKKDLSWEPLRAELVGEVGVRAHAGRSLPARHPARCAGAPTRIRPTAPTNSSRRSRRTSSKHIFGA